MTGRLRTNCQASSEMPPGVGGASRTSLADRRPKRDWYGQDRSNQEAVAHVAGHCGHRHPVVPAGAVTVGIIGAQPSRVIVRGASGSASASGQDRRPRSDRMLGFQFPGSQRARPSRRPRHNHQHIAGRRRRGHALSVYEGQARLRDCAGLLRWRAVRLVGRRE